MQVACPGCPTDTFRETLKPQTKLGSGKGEVPEVAWRHEQGLTAEDGMGSASELQKKSLEQRSDEAI